MKSTSSLKKKPLSRSKLPGAKKVSDIDRGRSFAFYGRSGTGKTTLACSFPSPILLLDIQDEGTDSVSDVKGLDVKEIESMEDLDDVYWWLVDNPKAYKTIVIDTVTQMQSIAVEEHSEKNKKKNKSGRAAGDWGTLSQRDWGDISGTLKSKLIDFRNLSKEGINVVFLAQDRTSGGEETEDSAIDPEVGPALSPSVAKTLTAAVSVVGNTFIRNKQVVKEVKGKKVRKEVIQYCLRVGPNPVYNTKIRKPIDIEAPAFLVNPSYESIVEIIKGD